MICLYCSCSEQFGISTGRLYYIILYQSLSFCYSSWPRLCRGLTIINQTPPRNAVAKNEWRCASIPLIRLHGVHREKFNSASTRFYKTQSWQQMMSKCECRYKTWFLCLNCGWISLLKQPNEFGWFNKEIHCSAVHRIDDFKVWVACVSDTGSKENRTTELCSLHTLEWQTSNGVMHTHTHTHTHTHLKTAWTKVSSGLF